MDLIFEDIDVLNTAYYNGKLMKLSTLDCIVQDYKEISRDKDLTKHKLMHDMIEDIPAVWDYKDIVESTYGKTLNAGVEMTPYFFVYMYIYADAIISPYLMGTTIFHNAPMYVGKGTIDRVCSHGQAKGGRDIKSSTTLRQYNLDFREAGLEPYVFILAKGLNSILAEWLEADVLAYFKSKYHYTRGDGGFRLAPPILNSRSEIGDSGYLMKLDGTFGNTK